MSLSGFIQRNAPYAFIAIIVAAVPTWWLNDRDPPYIREGGQIIPAPPDKCGFQADGKPTELKIVPGACLSVQWKIKSKRNCKPHGRFNVTRSIVDQQGKHPLPPIDSIYALDEANNGVTRYFVLPLNSPVGPAKYVSEAHFDCNQGQQSLPSVFWPICVGCGGINGKPGSDFVDFMVGDSKTLGPR